MKQIALVTGASRGIGKVISETFVKNGIEVVAPTRSELDLSDIESVENFISKYSNENINILINNAGVNYIEDIESITKENLQSSYNINVYSPILLTKYFAPKMAAAGYGKIVNISSIWSSVSKNGRGIYSSAKSAINSFSRTCAVEFSDKNVLVNAVAPGFVDTDLTRQNNTPEQISEIVSNIPIKRLADPKEIAELVLFLSSNKNSYITGQTIFIDGGFTCI